MIGPYDWLPKNGGGYPDLRNDQRWDSFDEHGPEEVFQLGRDGRDLRGMVGFGLACFSGNLVWPIEEFRQVGGFHPEMHHGRCEDGELGLRAVSQGIAVSMVRKARGWHLWHQVNEEWVLETNKVDVPIINRLHPWVENEGLVMTAKDGIRFDFRCEKCGARKNTGEYWIHYASCKGEEDAGSPIDSSLGF
jgi:hypothetical protein